MVITLIFMVLPLLATAQVKGGQVNPEDRPVDMNHPTFVPEMELKKTVVDGDSMLFMQMNNVYVYPVMDLKSEKQRRAFNRLVNNVKKVLPIAKETNSIIIETYEYLQTIPDENARKAHMKEVEAEIYKKYKPRMKKLTYSQGKLLIKLVNRECNSSSYDIVKAFMGPIRAGFWQAFAWTFGASLKKEYHPEGTDRLTERVVLMVEAGQL